MRRAGRSGRTIRRSIHLTPFGADFVRQCLPLEQASPNGVGEAAEPESAGHPEAPDAED